MTNIQNLGSKESLGLKFKDDKCAELSLKLWSERDSYFCNATESRRLWKHLYENIVPNSYFIKSVWKSNLPEAHYETLDSYFQSND